MRKRPLRALAGRKRWTVAAQLAAAVEAELAEESPPDEAAVAARLVQLRSQPSEERWSFRHIFFRLDRAASAEERGRIRDRARGVAEQAQSGADFAALARAHSESADAGDGGLVENQRPSLLDEGARSAIAALAEGEVSPPIETRTELHLFRLERRLTPAATASEKRRLAARQLAERDALVAARARLLERLRESSEIDTDELPWRIGIYEVTEEDLAWLVPGGGAATEPAANGQVKTRLVELLLLAEEGRRRGLAGELEIAVEDQLRREAVAAAFREPTMELVEALTEERLRPLYDARSSAFAAPEQAGLELIFVPQGRDPFATQRRLEDHVAELRAGASFTELARRISTGPEAERGGDLGLLPPSEWTRLNPEIYRAVLDLEPGEISDPIYCTPSSPDRRSPDAARRVRARPARGETPAAAAQLRGIARRRPCRLRSAARRAARRGGPRPLPRRRRLPHRAAAGTGGAGEVRPALGAAALLLGTCGCQAPPNLLLITLDPSAPITSPATATPTSRRRRSTASPPRVPSTSAATPRYRSPCRRTCRS